jgi:branched-chain amino acid transport system substrate-binding protein
MTALAKRRLGVSVLAMLVFFLGVLYAQHRSADAQQSGESKTLMISAIGPMSGGGASWGIGNQHGAELAIEEINARGGLRIGKDTYIVKQVTYDHKFTASEAVKTVNRAVHEDNAKLVNVLGSAPSLAMCPITTGAKVFQQSTAGSRKLLGPQYPFSFRTCVENFSIAKIGYEWLREAHPEIKTVAMINTNDESGLDYHKAARATADQFGIKVVAEEFFERGSVDFVPTLTKMMHAKPDFIDIGNMGSGDAGLIVKQARELGYKNMIANFPVPVVTTIIDVAGKAATEGYVFLTESMPESALASPTEKKVYEKWISKWGPPFLGIGLHSYHGVSIIGQAAEAVGSLDPDKVMEWLRTHEFETVYGKKRMCGEQTYGAKTQMEITLYIVVCKDGKLETLGKKSTMLP